MWCSVALFFCVRFISASMSLILSRIPIFFDVLQLLLLYVYAMPPQAVDASLLAQSNARRPTNLRSVQTGKWPVNIFSNVFYV
jgi:hypothetical protein